MITITAVFKGTNGSCGFIYNKQYLLEVRHVIGFNIKIRDTSNKETKSEYETIISFMSNWDNVNKR